MQDRSGVIRNLLKVSLTSDRDAGKQFSEAARMTLGCSSAERLRNLAILPGCLRLVRARLGAFDLYVVWL